MKPIRMHRKQVLCTYLLFMQNDVNAANTILPSVLILVVIVSDMKLQAIKSFLVDEHFMNLINLKK
jgi:hypothetical protein